MNSREAFKKNLKELMRTTKTKQIDISKYAEVSYQTVSAWCTGRGYPRPEAMEKLCQYFGVKKSFLTEDHNPEKTQEDNLLAAYRCLSEEGKKELLKRTYELVKLYPKRRMMNNGETKEKI